MGHFCKNGAFELASYCVRNQYATTVLERRRQHTGFLSHASVIYQIPQIRRIH